MNNDSVVKNMGEIRVEEKSTKEQAKEEVDGGY